MKSKVLSKKQLLCLLFLIYTCILSNQTKTKIQVMKRQLQMTLCDISCLTCEMNNYSKCTECSEGFFKVPGIDFCIPCNSSCKSCDTYPENCITCSSNYSKIFNSDNNICHENKTPPKDHYLDTTATPTIFRIKRFIQGCKYSDAIEITAALSFGTGVEDACPNDFYLVKTKKIIYSSDGSGLTYLQIVLTADGKEVNKTPVKAFYNDEEKKEFVFADDETIEKIEIHKNTEWITAVHLKTNKRSEVLGENESTDTREEFAFSGILAGIKAVTYVNGISSLQFIYLVNCDSKCYTCTENLNSCLSCEEGYYLKTDEEGLCLKDAPEGYFIKGRKIEKCQRSCETCTENETNCLKCASPNYYPLGDTFPTKCFTKPNAPKQYTDIYFDDAVGVNYFKKCHIACKYCQSAENNCLECNDNFFLIENTSSFPAPCYDKSNTPNGYFISYPDSVVKPCDKSCNGCSITSKNCLACANSFFNIKDQAGNCFDLPPEGYYLDRRANPRVYRRCDSSCNSCSLRPKNCQKCSNYYYPKFGLNSVCYSKDDQIDGFYLNLERTPNAFCPCPLSCKSCVSSTGACLECSSGYYFKEGTVGKEKCYNDLPGKNYYFDKEAGLFKACVSICAECLGFGYENCTKCISGFNFIEDTFINGKGPCTDNKPGDGYYLDNGVYRNCHSSCATCVNGTQLGCTSCKDTFYTIKEITVPASFGCYKELKDLPDENYYFDKFDNFFKKCFNNCKTCINDKYCKDCYSDSFKIAGDDESYCLKIEDVENLGYYLDDSVNLFKNCSANCKLCKKLGDDKCTACNNFSGLYFTEKADFYLPVGFDFLKEIYTLPPSLVGQSRAPAIGKCMKSDQANSEGYARNLVDNVFIKCKPNCKICQESKNEDDCYVCNSGYRKLPGVTMLKFTCYKSPPDNYYIDANNEDTFGECHSSCKKCQGPLASDCLECQSGSYILVSENFPTSCLASKSGYFLKNSVLNECDRTCSECTTEKGFCQICSENYFPKIDAASLPFFQCHHKTDQIEDYYFVNNLFMSCSDNCKYCLGSAKTDCSACKTGTYPINTDQKALLLALDSGVQPTYIECFAEKPASDYWLDLTEKVYIKCASNCFECVNSSESTCIKCASEHYFIKDFNTAGDKCYLSSKLPAGNYFLKDDLWQTCHSSCETCDAGGEENCLSCSQNYHFMNGFSQGGNKCYYKDSPPYPNYVLVNDDKFYKCTDNCATCYSNTQDKCKTCETGFYFKNNFDAIKGDSCLKTPPDNYFLSSDKLYWPCDDSCDQCIESSQNCKSCATGYYNKLVDITISKECYKTKPEPNFYLDIDIYKKCSDNCATCEMFGTKHCTSCASGFYPKAKESINKEFECFNTAPVGFYLENGKYNSCTEGCATCNTSGIKSCLTCDVAIGYFYLELSDYSKGAECYYVKPLENTYFDSNSNIFKYCHRTCKKCKGNLETQCIECIDYYYFIFDRDTTNGYKCYNTLPKTNMFLDTDKFYKTCHESCSECDKAGDKCLKCADSRYFKFGYDITGDLCHSGLPEADYYLDKSNSAEFLYKKCYDNCASCNEFGITKCNTCKSGFYFKEGEAIPGQCYDHLQNENYYLDDALKIYKLCDPACATCKGPQANHCTTCVSSYHFKSGESQPSQCFTNLFDQGFYLESNLWGKCANNCKTCVNGIDSGCSNCADYFYYKENSSTSPNKCYGQKPEVNYYLNSEEKLYKLCSPLCNSCDEFGADKCLDCALNSYKREESLNAQVFPCFSIKPETNYYLDLTDINNQIYRKCDSTCATCNLGATLCTKCNPNFYFKESFNASGDTCYNKLPDSDYYLDLIAQLYKPCNAACKTCVGGSALDCNSCSPGYNMAFFDLIPPMGCYNKNPQPNYYLDSTDPNRPVYRLCHSICATCRSFGISRCDTCIENYYFSLGYVGNGNRCFINKPFPNYYLDKTELIWKPCYYNCATCSESGVDKCLTCSSSLYYKEGDSSSGAYCYDDLPDQNYFFDDVNKIYRKCDSSCGTCDGSGSDNCLTCAALYYQKNGETGAYQKCYSLSSAAEFYLDTSSNTLKTCAFPCLGCKDATASSCISCQTDYHLIDTFDSTKGSVCYNTAPAAYYLDLTTTPQFYKLCASECTTCVSAGSTKCLTCSNNYTFKENYNKSLGDTCLLKTSLVSGFFYDSSTNQFKACSPNCNDCSGFGSDKCLECRENFYFLFGAITPNTCLGQAPLANYYLDNSNSETKNWVWKICDSSCKTCAYGEPCELCSKGSAKYCLSCADNFYFKENNLPTGDYCHNNLPSSNYFLDKTLTPNVYRKCSTNCATCLGFGDNRCSSCVTGTHFIENYDRINGSICLSGQIESYFVDVANPVDDKNSNNLYYKACSQSCSQCSAKEEGKCTKCFNDMYFLENYKADGDFCFNISNSQVANYYLDTTSKVFKKCDSSCETCLDSAKNCMKCSTNYYTTNQDYTLKIGKGFKCYQTIMGYYLVEEILFDNSVIKLFQSCNQGCQSCNNKGECLSCLDNTHYFKENYKAAGDVCYEAAPTGFYLDSTSKLYKQCNLVCENCMGPATSDCVSCSSGKYLYIPNALLISGKNNGECLENATVSNYYKDEVKRKLLICDENCSTCSAGTDNDCLLCPENSYFIMNYDITGDKCYKTTPDYHYLDSSSNPKLFKECSFNCLKCYGPGDKQCLECRTDFQFTSINPDPAGDFCASKIPISSQMALKKYVISTRGLETECSFNCAKCTEHREDKCIECSEGFYFIENFNKNAADACYRDKPYANLYLDKEAKLFRACDESCASCEIRGKNKCLKCAEGFYFKEGYNKEGDSCYAGELYNFYLDQSVGLFKYCGIHSGSQYLEVCENTKNLECKSLSMIDFSVYNKIEIPNIKVASESKKYSMQFWFMLVTQGAKGQKDFKIPFKSEEIIWDLHLKIKIENINNQIYVGCYPVYHYDFVNQSEIIFKKELITNAIGNWIKVSCSADQINSVFNLNGIESKFNLNEFAFADLNSVQNTKLIIKPGDEVDSLNNKYGFLFIKEFKLWTLYNNGIDSQDCKPELLRGNKLSNIGYLQQLVFYFENNQYSLNLNDLSNSFSLGNVFKNNMFYLEKFRNNNFKGHEIVNTNLNMDNYMNFPKLNTCTNLIISPTAGSLSETTFSIYLLSKYLTENIFIKLYYKYTNNKQDEITVDITNYLKENEINFKVEMTSEILESIPNPLNIQVYAEIRNINGSKEVLRNEINLYTNKLSLDFNELISSVLNSYEDINNLISADRENLINILDELNSFNERIRLVSDKSYSIPIMNDEGFLVYEEPKCTGDYCNGNGECVFIEVNHYCYCYEGFAGKRCQFTEKNHNLLKNYFKNITNNLVSEESGKVINNTLVYFNDHIKSTQNLLEEIEDLNDYVYVLETLINSKKDLGTNTNNFNSNLIMSIINNILSLTEQNMIKTKIDNEEMKLNRRIFNYKKSNSVKGSKDADLNKNDKTHVHKNHTVINPKNKTRYLSDLNDNDDILSLKNLEFSLDTLQSIKFNDEIKKIKDNIIKFTNELLNSNSSSDILKISNNNFYIQAKKISLDDIINFNKKQLFIERMINKKSYFDLEFNSEILGKDKNLTDTTNIEKLRNRLIKDMNVNKINLENCLGKINLIYIYNKNPSFNLGFSIANNSLTSSHIIEFFDCNLNKIDFSSLLNENESIKITHYLPIVTKNKDFIKNFNLNPEKYISMKNNVEKTITPFYVFPNGTIDRNPDLDYQIKNYHNNYLVRLLGEKESSKAKSISRSGYLIAESKTTGEFFSSTELNIPKTRDNNLFFLKYPQIFINDQNYWINRCFYALVILFLLNIIFVSATIIGKMTFNKNITSSKDLYEHEKLTILQDEAIFRQYFDSDSKNDENIFRYKCTGISLEKSLNNTSKNVTGSHNVISNKVFEQSKIILPNNSIGNINIDNKTSDNVEIELHVTNDFENQMYKESKSEKKNYSVVQNLGNFDSLENSEKFKTAENKKNDDEINRIIGEKLNENKKAHTFKNKSIKMKREEKNVISHQDIERELGINVITTNNQIRCCSGKFRSYLFFVFERNIYSSFAFVVSAFNPRSKHITKIFTLVYLLCGYSSLFVGLSNIDFKEEGYSLVLVYDVVLSVIVSNIIFALINLAYSSLYENKNIKQAIDSDFSKEEM